MGNDLKQEIMYIPLDLNAYMLDEIVAIILMFILIFKLIIDKQLELNYEYWEATDQCQNITLDLFLSLNAVRVRHNLRKSTIIRITYSVEINVGIATIWDD